MQKCKNKNNSKSLKCKPLVRMTNIKSNSIKIINFGEFYKIYPMNGKNMQTMFLKKLDFNYNR